MRLNDTIALVTGAGSGLGAAAALALAEAGADLVLVSRTRGELDKVAQQVEANGRTAMVYPADTADAAAMAALFAAIKAQFGRLDVCSPMPGSTACGRRSTS